MSGGVDSAVVAALLKKRGYDVIGITMQIWQESQRDPRHAGCCSLGAVEDARRCAQLLGIPHYVINFQDEFKETVIDEFVDEYFKGRTPNPCVTCNKKVKFEALLQKANELGTDVLATGHYARVRNYEHRSELWRSFGTHKDQSYVLYMLNRKQLQQIWFPLGELGDKAETRRLAFEFHLPVANKPDSQEVCFVSEAGGYREFLRKARPESFEPGELVDSSGKKVGEHQGVADFTVGQRRGVGVAMGRPMYVLKVDPMEKRVMIGSEDELMESEVYLEDAFWTGMPNGKEPANSQPMSVQAKIRYNMAPLPAVLYPGSQPRIVFKSPVKAITPGQIAVAYRGNKVVMGAKILGTSRQSNLVN